MTETMTLTGKMIRDGDADPDVLARSMPDSLLQLYGMALSELVDQDDCPDPAFFAALQKLERSIRKQALVRGITIISFSSNNASADS